MAELYKKYFETYKKAVRCASVGILNSVEVYLNRCDELSEEIDNIMYEIRDE